jgi:hypothetical protein
MSPSSSRSAAPRGWTVPYVALAMALSVLVAGCAAKSPGSQTKAPGAARHRKATAGAAARPPAPDPSQAAADSCEERLHNVSGLLLLYYALNHRLPETLEELAPLAEADTELRLTCPTTGQPFVYVPGGMFAPNTDQRLIIYEQSAAHRGLRWVVVVAPPPQPGQPPSTRVIPFSEERFRSYVHN